MMVDVPIQKKTQVWTHETDVVVRRKEASMADESRYDLSSCPRHAPHKALLQIVQ